MKHVENDTKIEHLKMIEKIIERMASNSFYLKGWGVSLISAILVFARLDANICFILIALFPAITFWYLDAFYLQLERKYRKLYEEVQNDFNDKTNNIASFDMSIKEIKVNNIWKTMWSISIMPIYLTLIITMFLIFCVVTSCLKA